MYLMDRQTDGRTDKCLKTEGPMILSIDIFYFKTVIIGGPINVLRHKRENGNPTHTKSIQLRRNYQL